MIIHLYEQDLRTLNKETGLVPNLFGTVGLVSKNPVSESHA